MTVKPLRKIDNDTFARALLMHAEGISWDEIQSSFPCFTKTQLENSVLSFKHDLQELKIFRPKPAKTKKLFFDHEDTGCYKSPSCLNCTLDKCIFDTEEIGKKHIWSEEENAYLRKEYPNLTSRELALKLGIPESAVRQHVSILGLTKPQKKDS